MPLVHEFVNQVTHNSSAMITGGVGFLALGGGAIKYMANAGQNERLVKIHRSKSTYQKDSRRKRTVEVETQHGEAPEISKVPLHAEGEMYGTVNRGWRVGFPFLRSYCKVSLRQQNGRLDDYHVMSPVITNEASLTDPNVSRRKWLMQAKVNFSIVDEPYAMNRAAFDFKSEAELNQAVTGICGSDLRTITKNMSHEALEDAEILTAGLEAVSGPKLLALTGVRINYLQLMNATVTDAQLLSEGSSSAPGADPVKLQAVGQTDLQLSTETSLHAV